MKQGDIIKFRYKGGRRVKGVVDTVCSKQIILILQTDYIGKNEEWFIGEEKQFNKSEMKNISVLTQ